MPLSNIYKFQRYTLWKGLDTEVWGPAACRIFSRVLPFYHVLPDKTRTYFRKFAKHDFTAWLCTNTYFIRC